MQIKPIEEIIKKINEIKFQEGFDMIVAIANGGIIPAAMVNQKLNIDFQIIKINFKDENQQPRYNEPKLLFPVNFTFYNQKILLVDDRIKTGSTIKIAKQILKDAKLIKTFAVNGNADYALYNEDCFMFPWNL
ncbi:MAG: phosphoribosyltransferase [Bacteroidales bacterium]|jgi:xanthine phosphoribosyltransferase|nr:phosphoribosyltransferase [Bacteroidales bacterium]